MELPESPISTMPWSLNDSMRSYLATIVLLLLGPASGMAENRSYDGTGNDHVNLLDGVAGQPTVRISYEAEYPDDGTGSTMITTQRANPRDISNAISSQSGNIPSARRLSDFIWIWGQFLAHDLGHTTHHNAAGLNGTTPISVNDPLDPFGQGAVIPFTRSDFFTGATGIRRQISSVSSYLDASQVYGSDEARAAALRTDNGMGAKLATSPGNLLPINVGGLANDNNGPFADNQLFLTGDVRANENAPLTSIHTIFMREHNRLVDALKTQQGDLSDNDAYQLARQIVGAELQIITYKEFLPALVGADNAPSPTDYEYLAGQTAAITQSFSHAAFRFGHSSASPTFQLVDNNGNQNSEISLIMASYNPTILTADPSSLDLLLKGAATQVSQEIDTLVIDKLRNLSFGPPGSGAGGTDLAALDIQRGRDQGLPDYQELSATHQLPANSTFDSITSDATLAAALSSIYSDDINNIDAIIGILAEDHLPGSSLGPLGQKILVNQFLRIRDADRLFYLSDDLGLYSHGKLTPEIASIIDLDNLTLADVIKANTSLTNLQDNVFFAENTSFGDFDGNGTVGLQDLNLVLVNWNSAASDIPAEWVNGRPLAGQTVGLGHLNNVLLTWNTSLTPIAVPEPHAAAPILFMAITFVLNRLGDRDRHSRNQQATANRLNVVLLESGFVDRDGSLTYYQPNSQ